MKILFLTLTLCLAAFGMNESESSTSCRQEFVNEAELMFKNAVMIKPRFSDYNLQGLLKWSLHFDFICEAHLEQLGTRYGIRYAKYPEAGQKWKITNYQLTMHADNAWVLQPIWIVADIVKLEGSTKVVAFSFWNSERTVKYASGTIQFDLADAVSGKLVPIGDEDATIFRQHMKRD